jgi:CubicO group peptidase (beta-lactamase class C family)
VWDRGQHSGGLDGMTRPWHVYLFASLGQVLTSDYCRLDRNDEIVAEGIATPRRVRFTPRQKAGPRHRLLLAPLAIVTAAAGCAVTTTPAPANPTATTTKAKQASAIVDIARKAMAADDLNAVILRVTVGGKPLVTYALGNSITGVKATMAMHFRNGAVAISYMSTLLMEYVDEHKASLDDKVSKWLPGLPDADQVTLKMLADMTSGYADYVGNPAFQSEYYLNPFGIWTGPELLSFGVSRPMAFAPGTNWGYAHTNYVILGEILEKVGGMPLATLLREKVLQPLGLTNTVASQTAAIPPPVLHAYSSDRRGPLGIPSGTPFYEESTYWNPSWTIAPGSVETTDIYDMTATAQGIGGGALLSKSSYQAQTGPNLLGFGTNVANCTALACAKQTSFYNYGLGIIRSGSWLLQNPAFGGYGAAEAYLPSKKIAIAVAVTYGPKSFDAQGSVPNDSDPIFRAIGAYLAPNDAPPLPPSGN